MMRQPETTEVQVQVDKAVLADLIRANLQAVRGRMAEVARRASRALHQVRLVAVTKTAGVDQIQILLEEGVRDLAESRMQAAGPKIEMLRDAVPRSGGHWHFIGHLQTNKVPAVLRHFQAIDSVDSERLLQVVAQEARKLGRPVVPCLVQVNVSGEAQKHGLPPDMLEAFLRQAAQVEACEIQGLMTMAPSAGDPEATCRPVFVRLRQLLEASNAGEWYRTPLRELSMGMSRDYGIAIEEGATMVRVGSGLFEQAPDC